MACCARLGDNSSHPLYSGVIIVHLLDLVATNSCSYLILHELIDIIINLFEGRVRLADRRLVSHLIKTLFTFCQNSILLSQQ